MKNEKLSIFGGKPARNNPHKNRIVSPGAYFIDINELKAIESVLKKRILYRHWGNEVSSFEEMICKEFNIKYTIALNSGTSALLCALNAINLKKGDEVILPCYSFIGIAGAITSCGATPVFCNINESLTIDVNSMSKLINYKTRAVIIVHMRGGAANLEQLLNVCNKNNILVIEDVAQAIGGSYNGKYLGTFSNISCFSLQFFKIITTGEGGLFLTDNEILYKKALLHHDASAFWSYDLNFDESNLKQVAQNLRMGELEGALGKVQFQRLTSIVNKLRNLKKDLINKIGSYKGIKHRITYDTDGEIAISLILILDINYPIYEMLEAIHKEGIEANFLLEANIKKIDRHFCEGWGRILGTKLTKGEFSCGLSKTILQHSLEIQIDPRFSSSDINEIALGLRKVFNYYSNKNGN